MASGLRARCLSSSFPASRHSTSGTSQARIGFCVSGPAAFRTLNVLALPAEYVLCRYACIPIWNTSSASLLEELVGKMDAAASPLPGYRIWEL